MQRPNFHLYVITSDKENRYEQIRTLHLRKAFKNNFEIVFYLADQELQSTTNVRRGVLNN